MAASPEFRPLVAPANVSQIISPAARLVASKSESSLRPARISHKWQNRSDTDANSALPYIFGVMALVAIGYAGFAHYWPATSLLVANSESSTTVRPAVAFVPTAAAPVSSAVANIAAPVVTTP